MAPHQVEQCLADMWAALDQNRDGHIDKAELCSFAAIVPWDGEFLIDEIWQDFVRHSDGQAREAERVSIADAARLLAASAMHWVSAM